MESLKPYNDDKGPIRTMRKAVQKDSRIVREIGNRMKELRKIYLFYGDKQKKQ